MYITHLINCEAKYGDSETTDGLKVTTLLYIFYYKHTKVK